MRFSNGNVVDRRRAAQVSDDTALLRTRSRPIRISIVDSDPVRLVGFSAVFRSKREFRLQAATLSELMRAPRPDVVLLASCGMRNLFDRLFQLTSARPDLRILATGADMEREEVILKAWSWAQKAASTKQRPPQTSSKGFKSCTRVSFGRLGGSAPPLSTYLRRVLRCRYLTAAARSRTGNAKSFSY
jgi:hypothetical protein